MSLKKATREELKRLGLAEMEIKDEGTAQFFIRQYQAKEQAERWKKEAEEANRRAAANWPAELTVGKHGVETASGCEFDIVEIEGSELSISITNRGPQGEPYTTDRADFLERVKTGYVIVEDYTPAELEDGIVKPAGEGEIWERSARDLQPKYDEQKKRFTNN